VGWALLRLNRVPEALRALQRSVGVQSAFCVGHARLGEAHYRMNDFGHALEALDLALADTQHGCDRMQGALLDRARVRIQLHQPDRAREDLRRCVELDATTREGRTCAELGRSVGT
jgi:tetratricopeptide (TPR) repeat protein